MHINVWSSSEVTSYLLCERPLVLVGGGGLGLEIGNGSSFRVNEGVD
jgi:hypothetical protein